MWIPIRAPTFKGQMQHMYPPQPRKRLPASFSFTIHHIQAAGLTIDPSTHMHEHLDIVRNSVKIYCPDLNGMYMLDKFSHHRVAM